ncbi:uncharacterized protein KY384_001513 [Bacidia gigantensis]|uniref:uncharacterized protein n=1 Tax=Bacidia gigantensis TaxID=2732470 RepID=UPI001D03FFF2|nr:uncharacterized protein KY384_001513 [Bacidia gigantensis]KAG8533772.1 hypothetical protein KY384_001513 [Bacidia gigantensis]
MSPSPTVPSQIAGYIVFPLSLPPLPALALKATHYLYIGLHQPKLPSSTASRSLFLVNLPFDATELHLRYLFSSQIGLPAGRIEEVQFEGQRRKSIASDELRNWNTEEAEYPPTWDRDLQTNGRTCVITFVDRVSMEGAFKTIKATSKQENHPVWGEGLEGKLPSLGYARYLHFHQNTYPDKALLLDSVNKYMTAYHTKEAAEETSKIQQRQEPDEEGFITVTRGGRSNAATQKAAQAAAEKHKGKRQGLQDFYRFQEREKKKARANELVKKFEQDRARISRMRHEKANPRSERSSLEDLDVRVVTGYDTDFRVKVLSRSNQIIERQKTSSSPENKAAAIKGFIALCLEDHVFSMSSP